MPITDVAQALKAIYQAARIRDREFLKLLKQGWRLGRLADHFRISKQRAQQIAARMRKNGQV